MITEIIDFLLHVLASVCGILLGAALANAWDKLQNRRRWKKERRGRR